MVLRKPYVINRGGQLISLFYITRVGTWSIKGPKHPYVIKERPLGKLLFHLAESALIISLLHQHIELLVQSPKVGLTTCSALALPLH